MRYICAAAVLAILIPTSAEAARHEGVHAPSRAVTTDRAKRPVPPRKRKQHHTTGDFWDVFPIPGLIPALNHILRG